jgi:hypothetical protein
MLRLRLYTVNATKMNTNDVTYLILTELLGFRTLSIVRILNNYKKNTTFRKLDLHPSSDEGRYLLCWVPYKELTSITGQPMSETLSYINT